jgi:hypothetical protein
MISLTRLAAVPVLLAVVVLSSASPEKPAARSTVVAKFGGECEGDPLESSPQLRKLVDEARQRTADPCKGPHCDKAFSFDLNSDGRKEWFVPLSCGATGNCTWGIFSDGPARFRGKFTAWFFYIHRRAGSWNTLSAYEREGGSQGVVTTLSNRRGAYVLTSERREYGYYGNSQPFLKRMGVPKCS